MSSVATPTLPTIGVIAQKLGEPLHRVEYVIKSRGIKPVGFAGNARIFSDAAVDRISSELQRIDRDRGVPA